MYIKFTLRVSFCFLAFSLSISFKIHPCGWMYIWSTATKCFCCPQVLPNPTVMSTQCSSPPQKNTTLSILLHIAYGPLSCHGIYTSRGIAGSFSVCLLICVRGARLYSRMATPVCIPASRTRRLLQLHSPITLGIMQPIFCNLMYKKWHLIFKNFASPWLQMILSTSPSGFLFSTPPVGIFLPSFLLRVLFSFLFICRYFLCSWHVNLLLLLGIANIFFRFCYLFTLWCLSINRNYWFWNNHINSFVLRFVPLKFYLRSFSLPIDHKYILLHFLLLTLWF